MKMCFSQDEDCDKQTSSERFHYFKYSASVSSFLLNGQLMSGFNILDARLI